MKPHFKTMKFKLFFNYSMIFFIAIFILLSTSIWSFSNNTTQLTEKSQANLCRSLINALDTEIEKMNTISMNVVYSNLIKSNFRQYQDAIVTQNMNPSLKWDSMNLIMDVITAIVGPFQTVSHVNLYSLEGVSVGSGILAPTNYVELKEQSWYDPVISLNGNKFLADPTTLDATMSQTSNNKDTTFIGLYRLYHNQAYQPEGLIEVLQDTHVFFRFFDETTRENKKTHVYVYNSNNIQIYPLNEDIPSGNFYYETIKEQQMLPLTNYKIKSLINNKSEVITYELSSHQGITVIVVDSLNELNATLYAFIRIFLVVVFIILFMVLLVSYWSANKVTLPLKKLANSFHQFDLLLLLNQKDPEPDLSFGQVEEIDDLNSSFLSMRSLLKESSNNLITARFEESRAKMLALQSLMNPHFIYNILTHISIMAEENMNAEIIHVSQDVSSLLRYITSEKSTGVSLSTEIDYTLKYLNCIKLRYGHNLSYTFNFPDELKAFQIPKLVIQPIVENSILHGFLNSPPWLIQIDFSLNHKFLIISVIDNGVGFDPAYIKSLNEKMQSIKESLSIDNISLGGLGILSVYLRLIVFFDSTANLSITNLDHGGAKVTLTIPIHILSRTQELLKEEKIEKERS